ncbi:MAG: carbamoyltransferase HypF [Candidatus Omnitrophica bacterium]|nr:carbamoyltransferase HypF [Candidatus Omnitrophota bacterium]
MSNKTILALGADIKNRILLAKGKSIFIGADINDLSQVKNFTLFKKEIGEAFKKAKPNIIAYDLHLGYFSTKFAETLKSQVPSLKLEAIQHHHAHIASVIQEHQLRGSVIGVSFDGTGYGTDGNSWGGEFLLVQGCNFKRLAHLKYRKMPGGDKVVSEPWRMVLSILGKKAKPFLLPVKPKDQELVMRMVSKNVNSPLSSSAGRLFDAAAALLGVTRYASYEAEGPIKLEAMCDKEIKGRYDFKIAKHDTCYIIDTDGLFLGMLQDLKKSKSKVLIATKFHNSMVKIIIDTVKKLSKSFKVRQIALSGGVFQNNFLRKRAMKALAASGLNVFTNVHLPVNDLNISLGQYYVSCCTGKG